MEEKYNLYNDNSSVAQLGKILNHKKIKYSKLDELFNDIIKPKMEEKQVNVIVDIGGIIKQLYNPDVREHFSAIKPEDRLMISSEIINLVGHYRHYFASRKRMYTRFFFTFSYDKSSYHTDIFENYRSSYYTKRINTLDPVYGHVTSVIQFSLDNVRDILKYIPNAYFINTQDLEYSTFASYIINELPYTEGDINLILSNDDLYYQDIVSSKHLNTYVLEMRGSEKSSLISIDNLLSHLLSSSKKTVNDFNNIAPNDILLLDAMVKHKEYDIPAVARKGYATGLALINKQKERPLTTFKPNLDTLKEYAENLFSDEEQQEDFKRNLELVNHDHYINLHLEDIKGRFESQILDIIDYNELMAVNEKLYNKFPLILDYILESEAYHE